MSIILKFNSGDFVQKTDGDYAIQGRVVDVVLKYARNLIDESDEIRYVVQTTQGMLLVLHGRQLEPWDGPQESEDTRV